MGAKIFTLEKAIGILNHNRNCADNDFEKQAAQRWIELFSGHDRNTTIQIDDTENVLLTLLEKHRENVLTQLSQPKELASNLTEEPALSLESETTFELPELDDEYPPECEPNQSEHNQIALSPEIPPTVEEIKTASEPAPQPPVSTPTVVANMSNIFQEPRRLAESYNFNLAKSLEDAFSLLYLMMEQGKQELAAMEARIDKKLSAIQEAAATAANNTETQKPMYASFDQSNRFKTDFNE